MNEFLWWRDGVIYQIYPRSFSDSDGDGLGDLPGIIAKLDYLADLGVDAIWLSPVYPSPDKDFGYDVSNYIDIDPRYGSLADFDRLVTEAHARGLRVVLDMVMNHTSDQHPWFQESRSSRENPKRDWYIWRDGRGGGPPNNWQASFGGPAWQFDPGTGQFYLHLFTREQPDVNWRNPSVRAAQLEAFRFWLERGVDGFRLDVFNAYFKHPNLPGNPPRLGLRAFDRQRHLYDIDQPEMLPLLQDLRRLLDAYPERYAVGETYFATPRKVLAYTGPAKLHAAFNFDFTSMQLIFPWSPRWLMRQVLRREGVFASAGLWPTTVLSNHDLPRAASRYGRGEADDQAKIAMALLLTLRGTPFMYYGEEIGMRDIHLKRKEILDPPGKKYWPIYKGRDGCRAPMQWDASMNAGFSSSGSPWLPLHPDFPQRNVAAQQADPDSLFHITQALLHLRKECPALRHGDFIPVQASGRVLAYQRRFEGQSILVALNFSAGKARLDLPEGKWETHFSSDSKRGARLESLQPHEILLLIDESSRN
jgi:alpha-glucosidase